MKSEIEVTAERSRERCELRPECNFISAHTHAASSSYRVRGHRCSPETRGKNDGESLALLAGMSSPLLRLSQIKSLHKMTR